MKTIQINDIKTITVKGIKARELGILVTKFNEIREKAETDEKVNASLNGLVYLFKEENKSAALMLHFIPQIIAVFYDELTDLLQKLFGLTQEEVDDLELDVLADIIMSFIEATDFKKIVDLLGKFQIPQSK